MVNKSHSRARECMALLLGLTQFAGCTQQPTHSSQPTPADEVANGAMGPVNLLINPGSFVTRKQADDIEYLQHKVEQSQLFAKVDLGVHRWPVTLEIRYSMKSPEATSGEQALGLANAVVAGATLGVIPLAEQADYIIDASLYAGVAQIWRKVYSLRRQRNVSLFSNLTKRDHESIDAVFDLMKVDLQQAPPLPKFVVPSERKAVETDT